MLTSNDNARLSAVLSTLGHLSCTPTTAKRLLIVETGATALEAIGKEVGETILRRILVFKTDASELVLDIGERRIYRICSAQGAWTDGCPDIVGKALARTASADVRTILSAFSAVTSDVAVDVRLPSADSGPPAEGVPAETVFVAEADFISPAFDVCMSVSLASVTGAAETKPGNSGSADLCEKLAGVQKAYDGKEPVVIWSGGLADNLAIAIFRSVKHDAAFAFHEEHLPDLVSVLAGQS